MKSYSTASHPRVGFWRYQYFVWLIFGILLPWLSVAQTDDVSALKRIWYGEAADTAQLAAGIKLIKLYHRPPMRLDSARIICHEMDDRGIRAGRLRWRANAWNGLGNSYSFGGQQDSALSAFYEALHFSREQDIERIQIYSNLGRVLAMMNQSDSALHYLKNGLDLIHKYQHGKASLPAIYGNMSICHTQKGDLLEGIYYEQESAKYGTDKSRTVNYYNIGIIFNTIGLEEEARKNFQQSLFFARKNQAPQSLLLAYTALIELASSRVEIDSLLINGRQLAEQYQLKDRILNMAAAAAIRLIQLNEYKTAGPLIEECLQLSNELEMEAPRANILLQKARLLSFEHAYKASQDICTAIEPDLQKLGNSHLLFLYDVMSRNFEALGQTDKALFYARKKDKIQQEIEDTKLTKKLISTYFQNLAQQEKSILQLEMAKASHEAESVQRRQTTLIAFISAVSLLLLLFVGFIYYYYEQKKKTAQHLLHLNEYLKSEQSHLKRKNDKLQRFNSIISHDILSNLDLMISAAHVLAHPKAPQQYVRQYVDMTQTTSLQLKKYCQELLAEARRETAANQYIAADPMPLIYQVFDNKQPYLRKSHVQVDIQELSPTCLPMAIVEQVFQNLVSNTLRYGAGAEKPFIRVAEEISITGEKTWIFEDNGGGIPPSKRNKLFQTMVPNADDDAGQGIGLSLLKTVLNDYHCDINAEERPGGGARFLITLGIDHLYPEESIHDSTPSIA